MYKFGIVICMLCFVFTGNAQLLDSLSLDTMQGYTSIQEALKNPDAVVKLVLRKQKFKSFPSEILRFKNLQYLDISKNNISTLPDSIGTLTYLQYFSCSKTGLQKIPGEIGQLSNLKYLNLNQNEIEYMPPQIGNLGKLEILDLWSNNFSEYPASLASLTNLKVLDLRNILINEERQKYIKSLLPKATIHMSPSCTCKW